MARFSDLLGDGDDDAEGTPDHGVDPPAPGSVDRPAGATPEEILERMARRDGASAPGIGPAEPPAPPVADGDAPAPRPDRSAFARLARETAYAAASDDLAEPGPADAPDDAPTGGPIEPEGLRRVDDDLLPRAKRRR